MLQNVKSKSKKKTSVYTLYYGYLHENTILWMEHVERILPLY